MAFVLGIDGGGTTTACLLTDETGREIARAVAPASNHRKTGLVKTKRAICKGIEMLARQIGFTPENSLPLTAICAGLAGVDTDEDERVLRQMFGEITATQNLQVVNDAEIALVGALENRAGVLVISGTGSIALAATNDGRRVRVGGWDYMLGDEGSGYSIGSRVLRTIAAAHDRRIEPTALADTVFSALKVKTFDELLSLIYEKEMTPQRIAALAPVADYAAAKGDRAAMRLVEESATELVEITEAAARLAGLQDASFPLVAMGGVLLAEGFFAHCFQRKVRERIAHARFVQPRRTPVEGAVLLALRTLGKDVARQTSSMLHQDALINT